MTRSFYYKDIVHPITGERMRLTAADQSSLGLKVQRQYNRWERERRNNERGEKKQIATEEANFQRVLGAYEAKKAAWEPEQKKTTRSLREKNSPMKKVSQKVLKTIFPSS